MTGNRRRKGVKWSEKSVFPLSLSLSVSVFVCFNFLSLAPEKKYINMYMYIYGCHLLPNETLLTYFKKFHTREWPLLVHIRFDYPPRVLAWLDYGLGLNFISWLFLIAVIILADYLIYNGRLLTECVSILTTLLFDFFFFLTYLWFYFPLSFFFPPFFPLFFWFVNFSVNFTQKLILESGT